MPIDPNGVLPIDGSAVSHHVIITLAISWYALGLTEVDARVSPTYCLSQS